jgi:TolA-binding protein
MRPVRIALLIAALGASQAQAGVFDDEEARRQIADQKIKTEARFDQQAKAQLDLANQIQRQAEEIARLRGQIETLNYELETAKKRQQDFYLDLDTRLRKFEGSRLPAVLRSTRQMAKFQTGRDPAKETQEYEAALNQFKAGKYKEAAAGFGGLCPEIPGQFAGAQRPVLAGQRLVRPARLQAAIEAQSVVTTKYADSPKAPDAWLAIRPASRKWVTRPAPSVRWRPVAKYPTSPARAETARAAPEEESNWRYVSPKFSTPCREKPRAPACRPCSCA